MSPVLPQLCLLTLLVWGIAQDLYLVTLLASPRWSQFLRGLPASSPGEMGESGTWQVEVHLDAWLKLKGGPFKGCEATMGGRRNGEEVKGRCTLLDVRWGMNT